MTVSDALQLATAALALAAALIGLANRRKIQDVHVSLNSRLTELVTAEHARGVGEGIATERAAQVTGAGAEVTP